MKRLIFLIITVFMVSGCSSLEKTESEVSQNTFMLNTICQITVYDMEKSEADEIIADVFSLCSEYEKKLSRTIKSSEISAINSSNGQWVEVSEETIDLIKLAEEYSKASEGKFDITIAPATELWTFTSENPTLPNKEAMDEAISHVGYDNIEIDGNKIRLKDGKAAIDLGGIAKGFIADRARNSLLEKGVEKAIIVLGGNVLTIGPSENQAPFKIGIQVPFAPQGTLFGRLSVRNMSVVTSGTYERFFEHNGVIYHHILDTSTGYPVNNGVFSVTVISSSSAKADALTTTCFVLGVEKGMELIESTEDAEAIFITDDFKPHYSTGINKTNFELLISE